MMKPASYFIEFDRLLRMGRWPSLIAFLRAGEAAKRCGLWTKDGD